MRKQRRSAPNRIVAAGLALAVIALPFLAAGGLGALPPSFDSGMITFTFDDGWKSVYDNAIPILNTAGLESTQFIATGFIDTGPNRMTTADLQEMAAQGHEIGSHSVTHADLTTLTQPEVIAELVDSKAFLEARVGPVYNFACPLGMYNAQVIADIQLYYRSNRTADPGYNTIANFDAYRLQVQYLEVTTTPEQVQAWIDQAKNDKTWLVLEYHQVDDGGGPYSVTPAMLQANVDAAVASGLPVMTVQQALNDLEKYYRTYGVNASAPGGHGSVAPAAQSLEYGSVASVAAAPEPGYHVASITDNGVPQQIVDPYTIDRVTADHDIVVAFAPSTPVVGGISPPAGPAGTRLTIDGSNFLADRGSSTVTIGGVPVQSYVWWSNQKIEVEVPADAGSGPVVVTTGGGSSNTNLVFTVTRPVWYLAEGSSAWGFETYISLVNPNPTAINCQVTYMLVDGTERVVPVWLASESRGTVYPADTLGQADFSTRVECLEGKTIAVDRTMRWSKQSAPGFEAHSSVGTAAPGNRWYLPEGSSAWGFDCWLLVQNPASQSANVTITYMIEGGGPATRAKVVPAHSRSTFNMASDIAEQNASYLVESDTPVIAERSMYRYGRMEGHCSIGSVTASSDFYLAEGSTDWGFTTYVLVQNPGPQPATVTLTYLTGEGPSVQPAFQMPPQSRKTIEVNTQLPGRDLSTLVSSDVPIVAERAMYWGSGSGEATHDSIGTAGPHQVFYLPDGEVGSGVETFILVQNPNQVDVIVRISYLTPSGQGNVSFGDTLPALTRRTYNMADVLPPTKAATVVVSETPGGQVMAERAMYWDGRSAGTSTIGGF